MARLSPLTLRALVEARQALRAVAVETPLLRAERFGAQVGADLYLKAESMQRTGSFKVRGAYTCVRALPPGVRRKGVVTASAGNHAQGVALAARTLGLRATVVMPVGTPLTKVEATRALGARIILHGAVWDEAYERAQALAERGPALVHPFDDWQVIAGQATLGLEILDELPDAEVLVVPVGGGGLIAGVALATKLLRPDLRVVGVQASAAPACAEAFRSGVVREVPAERTIADGIRVKRPGRLTFPIIQHLVDDVVLVDDEQISAAVVALLEHAKLLVEGAGAAPLAAILAGKVDVAGRRVVALVSGGNIDINLVARAIEHGLTASGRYLVISVLLPDRPGELHRLTRHLAREQVNIIQIEHHRAGWRLPIGSAEVTLHLETRDTAHAEHLIGLLQRAGYAPQREG
ncbi:MAG: threonine ammonia-lyase [Chloroflexi bacterium]|nr:threonine ammonia-lyase [Chloroflexota bacterium]